MEEKKKVEMKLSTIIVMIIILVLLVIALVVACFFATNKNNNSAKTSNTDIEQKDVTYFNNYLRFFLPQVSAGNFNKNIDTFSNEDISTYLYVYYSRLVNEGILEKDNPLAETSYTYTVSKQDMDRVVYKYFGIEDYEIIESEGREGIKKIDDETYQIFWFPTEWMVPCAEEAEVIYNDNNVMVAYELIDPIYDNYVGSLAFYLTHEDGYYFVKKIKYDEINLQTNKQIELSAEEKKEINEELKKLAYGIRNVEARTTEDLPYNEDILNAENRYNLAWQTMYNDERDKFEGIDANGEPATGAMSINLEEFKNYYEKIYQYEFNITELLETNTGSKLAIKDGVLYGSIVTGWSYEPAKLEVSKLELNELMDIYTLTVKCTTPLQNGATELLIEYRQDEDTQEKSLYSIQCVK